MKNLIISLFVLLTAVSCHETEPVIPALGNGDGNVPIRPRTRKVLIEEFTGVRCVNCPAGASEIEGFQSQFKNRVIAVAIHAGTPWAVPYGESKYDFRTQETADLLNYLGSPLGYPSAVINRTPQNNSLQIGQSQWGALVTQDLKDSAAVAIDLSYSLSENKVTTTLTAFETLPADCRITVLLAESGVVDYQLNPDPIGKKSDYVHNHILRRTLTPFDGQGITNIPAVGKSVTLTFPLTLSPNWKTDKLSVVAFVHRSLSNDRKVLQAQEVKIAP
jgi:hypothetical protein